MMAIRFLAAALVAVLLTGCAADDALTGDQSTSRATTSAAAPAAEPRYHQPVPGDFKLTIKTLEKQCFGEAGCNVTFRVNLAYDDSAGQLDPDKTYEITYRVRGGDEPLVNTLEATGDDYSRDREEFISTSSSSPHLTAKVTQVEAV
jgi:hypothetical protein